MAKTKGKVLEAAKQLQQLAPAEPAPKPKPDAPLTRVHGKGGKTKKAEMAEASGSRDGEKPDFDITWANFVLIKKHFDLSDKETTDVLLQVVGPDSSGSAFWKQYQHRVKQEIMDRNTSKSLAPEVTAAPEVAAPEECVEEAVAPKRRRLWPLKDSEAVLPDNQLGDHTIVEGTEFANAAFYDVDMDLEGEEEELEMDSDEDIEVPATTGRDDDPDSPSPGAVAVAEPAAVVCEAPPTAEPVRTPVYAEDPAKDAKDTLKDGLRAVPTAARAVPTAARAKSGRCVQHAVKRADDSDDDLTPLQHKGFLAFDYRM